MEPSQLHWICSVPVGVTIATLGLFGNIVSIIIWNRLNDSKSRRNKSTAFYFIGLSFCDSSLLVFFLTHDSIPSNHPDLKATYTYGVLFSWVFFPMFFFSLVASIWMVVGVTVNRYVMIAFPTKVQILYSNTRSKIGILAIMLFAFIVNLPHFFTYHVENKNGTHVIAFTEYGASEASVRYEFWAHCIVLVLVPWLSIAILNVLIIYTLKKQMKKITQMSAKVTKQERQERQMTRTLLFITFTFLFLLAWQCVTQCFWMLQFGKHDSKEVWDKVDRSFALAKLGVIINSSINWLFYGVTCSMFRKELRKLIGLKKKKSKRSASSSEMSSATSSSTTLTNTTSTINSSGKDKSFVITNTHV